MASIFKVPVTTTGPNAGLLRKLTKIDPRESAGTLALIAPGHPSGTVISSLPGTGVNQPVQNLFLSQAKALMPTATDQQVSAYISRSASFIDDTKGRVEITPKKGIHGIVRKSVAQVANDGVQINLDSAIRQYLIDNRLHNFYTSFWTQMTRVAGTSYSTSLLNFGAGSTSQDYSHFSHMSLGVGAWYTTLGSSTQGAVVNTTGSAIRRYNAGSGKPTMVATGFAEIGPAWSMRNGYNTAVAANSNTIQPSWIFYELLIEDLTVSGRTYAEVEAIDRAEFTKAFAPGGRYYGDTYTDPAVLP